MFLRAKYVLQLSRREDLQNTGIDQAIKNGLRACVTCDVISRYHRNTTLQNYNMYDCATDSWVMLVKT